jgi:hypothetical protein
MDRLSELVDKQDCIELVYRLARAIDRCDTALMESLFHPDATDDHGIFRGSAKEFIAWVMPVLQEMNRTHHLLGQVLIEVSGDIACGETYFVAHHAIPSPEGGLFTIAAGRYLDRFERREGIWKISHRQAVYDWSSNMPLTDHWDRSGLAAMRFGRRDTKDASYACLP